MPDIQALEHRCEEASPLSGDFYIPCNAPAVVIMRSDLDNREYRMCEPCAAHNSKRGMTVVKPYPVPPPSNNPPADANPLLDRLTAEAATLTKRRDELLAACERVPDIDSDEIAGKVADLMKLVSACTKNAEAARVDRKEPFLASGRLVDAFYRKITDPLDKAKARVAMKLTIYQRAVADAERRRREEAERLAREAAAEAARTAREAEEAMRTQAGLDAAVEAAERARVAQADAVAAEKAAAVKPAELSRTRGDVGAVASLRTFWDFTDLDRETLDLETLRQHLPADALEKAVRAFIKAGGRELRGVKIFENTASRVV
jgi:hypothetical protein